MKRVSCIFCITLVLITCLVNPVSAAETGIGAVDLLGLGYIEANGVNVENMRVNLSSARSGSIWFPVELPFGLGQFELLVMSSDPSLTFKRSDNAVTYEKYESGLGDNYYVVRGNFSGRGKTLNYTSSGSGSGDYFFVVSAKAMPINYGVVDIPFQFQVWDASNGELLDDGTYSEDAEYWDDPFYTDYDGVLARQIRIYPDKDDLAGLDYFDLDLYFMNLEIDSISASFGGNALDIQYTETIINDGIMSDPITDGVFQRPYPVYKVVLRVDVSGVNLLEGSPTVFITYTTNNYMDARPYVYVYGINAGKYWNSTEPEVTLLYRIFNTISSGFSNLNTWIQNMTSSITSSFVANFDRLGVWLTNQNTLISNKFNDLHTMLVSKFNALEAAIRGDTAPGDSFQDQVEDKDQEFNDMAAIMDSVEKPSLNSVDVSADAYVDSTVLVSSMSGVTSVIGGPLFFDMIVMSIMMCTAGYVLFGKR